MRWPAANAQSKNIERQSRVRLPLAYHSKRKGERAVRGLSVERILGNLLLVTVRALQIFSSLATALLLAALPAHGGLSTGTTYSISFLDLDGNKLSTADGHMTILVLSTSADREQARPVGVRVPALRLDNTA